MKLRQALLGCSTGQLGRIAAAWRFEPEAGALRRELVEHLASLLAARAADGAVWERSDPTERQAVRLVARAGGRHQHDLLARRLARSLGARPDDRDARAAAETALGGLVERGILFRLLAADRDRPGVHLVCPDEILAALAPFLNAERQPGPLALLPSPVAIARCSPAHDLFVLASALRREAWSAASRGLAGRPARTVGNLLAALQSADNDGPGESHRRWRFLLWLGQRAGWIDRSAWPVPDEQTIDRLLGEPWSIPRLALEAGGLAREPAASQRERAGVTDPATFHADGLQLLAELEPGTWVASDALSTWILAEAGPDGTDERPRSPEDRPERRRSAESLRRWLEGRWFWFGLVDWGWGGAAWDRVAVAPILRATVQDRAAESVAAPFEPCRPDGELRLVAPPGADLAGLYRCERFLVYTGGGTGDRCYALTPASFARGVRLGGDADELVALLRRLLQTDPPERWRAAIAEWSGGRNRLRLGPRLVLSADDASILEAVQDVPGVRAAVVERLAPTHAAIGPERLAELLTELAQAGLPVDVDPSLRAEPADAGRASALADGVAEAAWVALELLRRIAPDVVAGQRDLQAARRSLDATLPAAVLDVLERRAATIGAAIADQRARRRPARGTRRRVV